MSTPKYKLASTNTEFLRMVYTEDLPEYGVIAGDLGGRVYRDAVSPIHAFDYIGPDVVIYDGSVHGGEIRGGRIYGGRIYGGRIYGGTVYGGDIYGGTVYGGDIYGGEIRGGEIDGGNVYGGEIHGGEIHGGNVYGGRIYGGEIRGGEIRGGEIRGGTLYKGAVYDGVVRGGKWRIAPLFLNCFVWPVCVTRPWILRVGCEERHIHDWIENFDGLCEEHSIFEENRPYAMAVLRYVDAWMQQAILMKMMEEDPRELVVQVGKGSKNY